MFADASTSAAENRPRLRLRADRPIAPIDAKSLILPAVFTATAIGFVVIGGGNLDLGPVDAKLGLSAVEPLGPFGQAFGGWEPAVWVGSVLPSRIWAAISGMQTAAIVRWPAAIAGMLIGLVLVRSLKAVLCGRAALLGMLCWFGGIGLMDRSGDLGLELVAGLGTILALNRMLTKGSDWIAGLFAAWAFLAGGWPTIAVILLASIVLGRQGATFSLKIAVPIAVAFVGWSAWALATTRTQAWVAALSLPATQGSAWTMALAVIGLGLPWSPFALFGFSRSIRAKWSPTARPFVIGWGQVALASLIVGSVVPGLASAATMPALAGLAIVAAASWDALIGPEIGRPARRVYHVLTFSIVLGWTVIVVLWGTKSALSVAAYRPLSIGLIVLAIGTTLLMIGSARNGDRRGGLIAMVLVAIGLKLAHWGYYVPESNYRRSQGPWARAVAQWVPPRWPIHVLEGWSPDFAFALEHPVRRIVDPRLLPDRPGPSPKFILLHEADFTHWQDKWPKVVKVARFEDEWGSGRVLARTEGEFRWRTASSKR